MDIVGDKEAQRRRRSAALIACAIVLPPLLTWTLSDVLGHVDNANIVLVLVVVIVAIASTGHRVAAAIAAVWSGVWFDFFQTVPYHSFSITNPHDVETTVLLVVVGLAVGELASRGRASRRAATRGAGDLTRISTVSGMLAAGESAEAIIDTVSGQLTELLQLQECRFDTLRDVAYPARIDRDGEIELHSAVWATDRMGLPGDQVELPVQHRGVQVGRFLLTPTRAAPVPLDSRLVAVALADQVGAAIASRRDGGLAAFPTSAQPNTPRIVDLPQLES